MATFLENKEWTHLFRIDSDIGFSPDSFYRLLLADKDVVAGVYPLKRENWPEEGVPAGATQADFERMYTSELQNKGIPNENVTRIYSELEPCSAPGGYCNDMIKNGSPSGLGPFNNAKVTYSFSYGGSPHNAEAARQGVEKLKRARQKQ